MSGFQALDSVDTRGKNDALKFAYNRDCENPTLTSKSSFKMKLRSGYTCLLRWLGASDSNYYKTPLNILKNQNSIKALLNYIEDQSNSAVREYVATHHVKLDGDAPDAGYTVNQRYDRASFINKGMVQQMKQLALKGVKAENQNIVENFLGSASPDKRILAEQGWDAGRNKEDIVGQRKNNSPLANLVLDICEGAHPTPAKPIEKYPRTWAFAYNAIRNSGSNKAGEEIQRIVRREVQAEVDKANERGELVDPKNIEHAAIRALTRNANFLSILRGSNQEYRNEFVNGTGLAQEAQNLNDDVRQQNICRSLGRVIRTLKPADFAEKDADGLQAVGNNITQDEIDKVAATLEDYNSSQSFLEFLKTSWKGQHEHQDEYDQTLDQTVNQMLGSLNEEADLYQNKDARQNLNTRDAHRFIHSLNDPEELNDVNFGKKSTKFIGNLIQAHRKMESDHAERGQAEQQFKERLKVFPDLQDLESKVLRGTVPSLERGKVGTNSEFLANVIDQFSDQFDDQKLAKIQDLKEHLQAFDEFEEFQRQRESVDNANGLRNVDNVKRQNLEDLANKLQEDVTGIKNLVDQLDDIDHDPLTADGVPSTSEIGSAVIGAANQIGDVVKNYTNFVESISLNEAQSQLRQLPHLQKIRTRTQEMDKKEQEHRTSALDDQIEKAASQSNRKEVDAKDDLDVSGIANRFAWDTRMLLTGEQEKQMAAWQHSCPDILAEYAVFAEKEAELARLDSLPNPTENQKLQLTTARAYVHTHRSELKKKIETYQAITHPLRQIKKDDLQVANDETSHLSKLVISDFESNIEDFWNAGRMMQLRLDETDEDNSTVRFSPVIDGNDQTLKAKAREHAQWISKTKSTVAAIAQTVLSKDEAISTTKAMDEAPIDNRHARRFRNDLVEAMEETPVPENYKNSDVEFLQATNDDIHQDINKLREARKEVRNLWSKVNHESLLPDIHGYWNPGQDKPVAVSKVEADEQSESDPKQLMLNSIRQLDDHYSTMISELTTIANDYNSYVTLNNAIKEMDEYVPPQSPKQKQGWRERFGLGTKS
ncbi:hypothetical protein AB1L42_01295 [Thalassoglobus sp. JC818]|uniref:hypothetical protein n=1 Tax=Thalassoglobus sp. JC818 TaxID=3232136 RepID=UPI003459FE07